MGGECHWLPQHAELIGGIHIEDRLFIDVLNGDGVGRWIRVGACGKFHIAASLSQRESQRLVGLRNTVVF